MADFTVKVTYPAGESQVEWNPEQPTLQKCCKKNDTVSFTSPDKKSVLIFSVDSPFQVPQGPKLYEVVRGGTVALTIADKVPAGEKRTFHFFCAPDGILGP